MSDAVELAEVPQLFERWLAGRPLAERSRREYARNVRAYCAWLAATPDRDGWQGDPLTDALARDHATRDFRRYLQVEKRAAASTVNLALASLDALYRCLGLGCPHVRRDKPSLAAPRALDEAGQRRLLRAAEGAPHDVDRAGRQRDVFDVAAQPLDVLDPGLALVLAREGEHLVRHVEAVGLARRAEPTAGRRCRRPSRGRAPSRPRS